MRPPAIDRAVGMWVYSTGIPGIGGRIKETSDHFSVEEILDPTLEIAPAADDAHAYPLYLLSKRGIDSTHALQEVRSRTGLRLKVVGLKDARAITKQFASLTGRKPDARERMATKHCSLDLVGFTSRPITKRVLAANRFIITVSDLQESARGSIEELQDHIRENALANFYGHQRFGSARPVTHLVGREMVKRNFIGAVELFLTYTGEYEGKERREIREMCRERSRFAELLQMMPPQMDLERILVAEMMRSGDPIKALRRLPVNVRRLFVQAYQSYIFNRSLSTAITEENDITTPEHGDICISYAGKVVGMKRFDGSDKTQLPAIPLAGYAFRESSRFGTIVRSVMEEEEVSSRDFYLKEMQEVSLEGGFRQAPIFCRESSFTLDDSLQARFVLPKGSYATVLLRELMKPEDPVAAGF